MTKPPLLSGGTVRSSPDGPPPPGAALFAAAGASLRVGERVLAGTSLAHIAQGRLQATP